MGWASFLCGAAALLGAQLLTVLILGALIRRAPYDPHDPATPAERGRS